MKLGFMAGYSPAQVSLPLDLVLEAERLGFDSVWTSEAYSTDAVTPAAWILARTHTTAQGDVSVVLRRDGESEDLRWLMYHYGVTWYFQLAYRDPGGPLGSGFNLSDALEVDFE